MHCNFSPDASHMFHTLSEHSTARAPLPSPCPGATPESCSDHCGMEGEEALGARETRTLSFSDVAALFADCTVVEAAGRLGVGVTNLKRRCRELGVPHWPYRQARTPARHLTPCAHTQTP